MTRLPRDRRLSVRIPQRIFVALETQAEKERRSVADVLNNMLEERYVEVAATRAPRVRRNA